MRRVNSFFRWFLKTTPEHGLYSNLEVVVFAGFVVMVCEMAVFLPVAMFFYEHIPWRLVAPLGIAISLVAYFFSYRWWRRVNEENAARWRATDERLRLAQERLAESVEHNPFFPGT